MKLKNLGNKLNTYDMIEKLKSFDPAGTGKIKIYHFINFLKHNFGEVFDSNLLIGL
jgi:hypothetical protein